MNILVQRSKKLKNTLNISLFMKTKVFEKNFPNWDIENIIDQLDNFISIYEKRPIRNNKGGMLFSHMFFFYIVLKNLNPNLVIESGVYKGQSTWLIEKTLPEAEIISLDIDLSKREYISKKVFYSSRDFKFQNFKNVDKNSLVFFDDHVNHIDRINDANFFGIKNIVLEDNYPAYTGDFQSLKQIYNDHIFNHTPNLLSILKTIFLFNKISFRKIISKTYNAKEDIDNITKRIRDGYSEKNKFEIIDNLFDIYFEFLPLLKNDKYFNDGITKKPLLEKIPEKLSNYSNEINYFNYLTYIKLK